MTVATISGKSYRFADLPARLGKRLSAMPVVHRLIVENVMRTSADDARALAALDTWLSGERHDVELPFRPARIMMHDTTCVPALVDLAATRSALAEAGGNPRLVNPVLPVDVSTDHSIAVDMFARPDAIAHNMRRERERNGERLRLMKWATQSFHNLRVHPPGTGIMHTLNIERLATVAFEDRRGEEIWAAPETLIGTDSHTPMINGLGVLAWGVGGLEAEAAMLGEPVMLRVPRVVGVRLTGELGPRSLPADLALLVTERLRNQDVTGCFVEFFGRGIASLNADARAVIANMAPEYGATTGYFPVDARTIAYLRATGRSADHCLFVEHVMRRQGLWFDPDAAPAYETVIDIDLSVVARVISGPTRPHDRHGAGETGRLVSGDAPVAIAAITSCTNTSDPRQLIAAGLLARNAYAAGLTSKPWVKTSLAPGSPAALSLLERAGLIKPLEALGFGIVGFGCTTCIGNSGQLLPAMEMMRAEGSQPVAVLCGNRNFPGRVHPDIVTAFLMSPPLVIAFALAGDVVRDIETDPLGMRADGSAVHLADLWPSAEEIDAIVADARIPSDLPRDYDAAEASPDWKALEAPMGDLFPWDTASAYVRRPPFLDAEPRTGSAMPILVLGDDVTTDHISPAGAIPPEGEAGRFLIANGADPQDLNVFASRRGNWEVMVRGLFTNPTVVNHLDASLPPGWTVHAPTGTAMPLWDAAKLYDRSHTPLVIVAGKRYGTGSSRDWGAKGPWLLGVRAVLAESFERIHRSNLINMGILPLIISANVSEQLRSITVGALFDWSADQINPGGAINVQLRDRNIISEFRAQLAVETQAEAKSISSGGLLPSLFARLLDSAK